MYWEQSMTGKRCLQAVMQSLGVNSVCLVAVDVMNVIITIIAKFQRELMELQQQSIHNTETYMTGR